MSSIAQDFARAGCRGWLHVREVDGAGEVELDSDEPVVAASVFKVLVALEFFRQVDAGRLNPVERVDLRAGGSTPGPTGFSTFADDVSVSLRDLARMMLVVSDNAATDILLDRVGLPAVEATVAELGLTGTVITGSLQELLDSIGGDLGFAGWRDLQEADDPEVVAGLQRRLATVNAFVPEQTTRTTARDMTALLRLIWRDEAGPAQACAQVRRLMAAQVTRHRLAAGFPAEVRVSAKSGSLLGVVRNEIGVLEYPDGARYAAAVFTRADEPHRNDSEINAAIGTAAARGVRLLRD
ncbi:MAG TPA: serine hydrolase [Actinoplanes sp.]|nr:serine hydrolase [Actinoplanes sp.]